MKYLNREKKNPTERAVQKYFHSQGYTSMCRGWPDFVFFKRLPSGKKEYIFVEVKRPDQNGIKAWQRKMKNIFTELGLTYKVAFGLLPDGTPDYRELPGLNRPPNPIRLRFSTKRSAKN